MEKYRKLDEKINSIWREIAAAPSFVPTIDWADWEAKIEDKTTFRSIKKQYEQNIAILDQQPIKVDVYQTPEEFETELKRSKIEAARALGMVRLLTEEADAIVMTKSEWPFWTSQQHLDSVPGVEAEYDRLAADLRAFVPTDVFDSLEGIDLQANIVDVLDRGQIPDFDLATFELLPPESPVRIAVEQEYADFSLRAKEAGASPMSLDAMIEQARTSQMQLQEKSQ